MNTQHNARQTKQASGFPLFSEQWWYDKYTDWGWDFNPQVKMKDMVVDTVRDSAETARRQAEQGAKNVAKTVEDTAARTADNLDQKVRALGADLADNAVGYGLSSIGG